MIDMASVYAERFKQNPQALQAAVMGQSPDPKLDPYTALNALRLVKEANMMAMAGKAQQPTSAPSIVSEAMSPPQGLAAMMPMGAPAARLPPQPQQAPQAPVMQASGGLAGLPTPDEDYAAGGIVAFKLGGGATSQEVADENDYQGETDTEGYSDSQGRNIDAEGNLLDDTDVGTGDATKQYNKFLLGKLAAMDKDSARVTSPEEQDALFNKYLKRETDLAGPDIYGEEIKRGAQDEVDRGKRRNTGEAMALLTAAGKVLKGHNLAMGASEALPAYAQQISEVDRADQAARDANRKMQFALKDAQRKERTGNIRSATASMENYRKFQQDENKAVFERNRAVADLAAKGITANRPRTGAGAGGPKVAEQLAAAEIAYSQNPTPQNKAIRDALSRTVSQTKTSFSTSEIAPTKADVTLAPIQARIDAKVADSMKSFPTMNTAYRKAQREGNTAEAQRLWNAEEARWRGIHSKAEKAAAGKRGGAGAGTAEEPIKLD